MLKFNREKLLNPVKKYFKYNELDTIIITLFTNANLYFWRQNKVRVIIK